MALDVKITLSAGLSMRRAWPSGKPVSSEALADGWVKHILEDGRSLTVRSPTYRLDYLSTWVGAEAGETYEVNIGLVGLSAVLGFYEVWNFDIGEARNYSFAKTIRLTSLVTGDTYSREELLEAMVKNAHD